MRIDLRAKPKLCLIFALSAMICMCFLAGCSRRIPGVGEIDEISFINVIGVDKVPGDNPVRLTITSKHTRVRSSMSIERIAHIISADGKTMLDATRNLIPYSDKKPFWGHVDIIAIDEEAARDDMLKYLNYFMRDPSYRFNAKVLIIRGSSAEDFISGTSTELQYVSDRLNNLFASSEEKSVSRQVLLHEAGDMFNHSYESAILPVACTGRLIKKEETDADKIDIILSGFAVFKGTKLFGFLDDQDAQALNFLTGKFKYGITVVEDETGGNVALDIIRSDTRIKPTMSSDGNLSVIVAIKVKSNIGEQESQLDLINQKSFEWLENQQQKVILHQTEKVAAYAQENGIDIFKIWDAVRHKYPQKWAEISGEWLTIFSDMPISIEVKCIIKGMYDIKQPLRSAEDQP